MSKKAKPAKRTSERPGEPDRLVTRFEEQLASFERVRGLIERCHALADQFRPAVVKKVVADYESKCLEVVGAISLLQPDLESALQALRLEHAQVTEGAEVHRLASEELDLRLAIGEMSAEDHEQEAAPHLAHLQEAESRLARLEEEIDLRQALLARWVDAGQAAGVLRAA